MEMRIGYLGLIAAAIHSELKNESWEYALTVNGRYWCGLGNLDPVHVARQATTSFAEPSNQTVIIPELDGDYRSV
jgi:hypothetical protein